MKNEENEFKRRSINVDFTKAKESLKCFDLKMN